MKHLKIVIEKHADGYVAYPVGVKGVVVGEGDTFDEALQDVTSALRFHLDTFGPEGLEPVPSKRSALRSSRRSGRACRRLVTATRRYDVPSAVRG
jgi:predicted RNase H-like HicB family nuclease